MACVDRRRRRLASSNIPAANRGRVIVDRGNEAILGRSVSERELQ